MARYPTLSLGDVEQILKNAGFVLRRRRGSHAHWVGYVRGQRRIVTVDRNDAPFTSRNRTLHSMIRQSGLTKKEFFGLLYA